MNTIEKIRSFIVENFLLAADGLQLDDNSSLLEEGVVDSTGVLDLILFVEQTFGVNVDDEDVVPDNFDSIHRIASYVETKLQAQNPVESRTTEQ